MHEVGVRVNAAGTLLCCDGIVNSEISTVNTMLGGTAVLAVTLPVTSVSDSSTLLAAVRALAHHKLWTASVAVTVSSPWVM